MHIVYVLKPFKTSELDLTVDERGYVLLIDSCTVIHGQ